MPRQIINPRWGNTEKTHIVAGFRYEDGKEVIASITNVEGSVPNPDWTEIMETFGPDKIDENTKKGYESHLQKKRLASERRAIEIERAQQESLFNAKAEVFDMDIVKNSLNRDLKNKIRRASTITEVNIYAAMLHMLEDPMANTSVTSA